MHMKYYLSYRIKIMFVFVGKYMYMNLIYFDIWGVRVGDVNVLFCNTYILLSWYNDIRKSWNLWCTMYTDNRCCCDKVTKLSNGH